MASRLVVLPISRRNTDIAYAFQTIIICEERITSGSQSRSDLQRIRQPDVVASAQLRSHLCKRSIDHPGLKIGAVERQI
jgi:hypothetical protein